MTLEACAETLQQQDPDRFGAVLAADPADRPALISLYALNLELARAPFQSAEPMLAEMRLQWWVDRLDEMGRGTAPPLHDVLTPLWDAWGADAGSLVPLAEARRQDAERRPFGTVDQVMDYIDATSGGLMWAAATRLGAPVSAHHIVAAQGRGAGLAAWLRALPRLREMGMGLPPSHSSEVAELAELGLAGLAEAARGHRADRHAIPRRAAPALFAAPGSLRLLQSVRDHHGEVLPDLAAITPFRRRAALAWLALGGRWWVG